MIRKELVDINPQIQSKLEFQKIKPSTFVSKLKMSGKSKSKPAMGKNALKKKHNDLLMAIDKPKPDSFNKFKE